MKTVKEEEKVLMDGMLIEAQRQYSLGKYKDCLKLCEEMYLRDASAIEVLLLLGATHYQLHEFAESVFYNQQCIRAEPKRAEAYNNLGNGLAELGDAKGAMQFYLKAIKYNPRYAHAYNNLASTQARLGQLEQAIESYQMALVIDPTFVDAHCNLANIYKIQGISTKARKQYLQAIRLKPDFAMAWSNLAGLFKSQGQLKTAIAYYREAIRLCPPFADVYCNLGAALIDQGHYDQAKQCLATAISLRPDLAAAHANLGACLLSLQQPSNAIKSLRHAVQIEPNFPDAYNTLGNALRTLALHHLPETVPLWILSKPVPEPALPQNFEEEHEKAPKSTRLHQSLCQEAIASYRTALKLKPNHHIAYTNLGVALRERGQIREAIHCQVTAARLDPHFATAHCNLANLLRDQGRLQQAIAHYLRALALDDNFALCQLNLGHAYLELGTQHQNDAQQCYQKALEVQPSLIEAQIATAQLLVRQHLYDQAFPLLEHLKTPSALSTRILIHQHTCNWSESFLKDSNDLARLLEAQLLADGVDDEAYDILLIAPPAPTKSERRDTTKEHLAAMIGTENSIASQQVANLQASLEASTTAQKQTTHLPKIDFPRYTAGPIYAHPLLPAHYGLLPAVSPYAALTMPSLLSARDTQRIARRCAAALRSKLALSPAFRDYPRLRGANKYKVGYLSSRFFSASDMSILPAIALHDRSFFNICCYALPGSTTLNEDETRTMRRKLQREWADELVELGPQFTTAEAAAAIRNDGVHVLIYLDGYFENTKPEILAYRPAPVQISLGYPGTLGMGLCDYIITDPTFSACDTTSQHQIPYFDEKCISLPYTNHINAHSEYHRDILMKTQDDQLNTMNKERALKRQRYGLPEDHFVFCYHGDITLIDKPTWDCWIEILRRVPNSSLWLCASKAAQHNLVTQTTPLLSNNCPDLIDRLIFSDAFTSRHERMCAAFIADLALQPLAFDDTNCALDALFAGTPVVALKGHLPATRVAASLLSAAQCSQLAVATIPEYTNLTVRLASDAQEYWQFRTRVDDARRGSFLPAGGRSTPAPLFDTPKLIKALEFGLVSACQRALKNLSPQDIFIEAKDISSS